MQRSPRNLTERAARWSAAHKKTVIVGWLLFVFASVAIGSQIGTVQQTDADQYAGESSRAEQALIDHKLREPASESVLVQSSTHTANDPAFREVLRDLERRMSRAENVENVSSPLNGGGSVARNERSALFEFEIAGDPETAEERVDSSLAATAAVQRAHPDFTVEQFGSASVGKAFDKIFEDDLAKAEKLSLPVTLVILVIAFGALMAAGLPVLLAISAVMATIGLVALPSQLIPVSDGMSSVILLIGMAVGIDYSLFYLRRERDERRAGRNAHDALMTAAATSGKAVLISGLTVMVAMAGMLLTGSSTFSSFGIGTMLVAGVAVLGSLTVLPAALAGLGDRVDKGRVRIPFRRRRHERTGEPRMMRIVDLALRRPVLSVVLSAGLLVALTIPALSLTTRDAGIDSFPKDTPIIQTYENMKATFPSEGISAEVVVEAENVRSGDVAAAIADLRERTTETAGFPAQTTVRYAPDGGAALIEVPVAGDGFNSTSISALERLRDDIIPATVGSAPGTETNVTGPTAASEDFNALVSERAPLVFAFVLGLAFLLLLVTFRSIVIPLKAIVLNLLSVGAAYGVLVLVFQEGWGESLLGFESNGAITSWLPLFLFVILFGLSMDYHVFILSRIRELVTGGMSTDEAVAKGIKSTAGVVTSAAIVMVAVFAIFATLSTLDMKQMGVGLAVAVLIDATIVRVVLLPATMKLLGKWNWYLPKSLNWLPKINHEAVPQPSAA